MQTKDTQNPHVPNKLRLAAALMGVAGTAAGACVTTSCGCGCITTTSTSAAGCCSASARTTTGEDGSAIAGGAVNGGDGGNAGGLLAGCGVGAAGCWFCCLSPHNQQALGVKCRCSTIERLWGSMVGKCGAGAVAVGSSMEAETRL